MEITDWIIAVSTAITTLIFFGILFLTRKYARSTKAMADATKQHIELINEIEKVKLTYKLIEEWSYDKKLLTFKREKIGIHFLKMDALHFNFQKSIEFIEYFNNLLDYFTIVDDLMENGRINKKLYLKKLSREIVNFYEKEYETNEKFVSGIRDRFRMDGRSLPVTSDFSALRKIYEIARNELNK